MKIGKRKWELNWSNPKLYLKYVNTYKGRNKGRDRGYGVFTNARIKKDEILTIFGGYVIPIKEVKKIPSQLQEYCYQINDDFFYGPVMKSEISLNEHYNHNCDANAGFKDTITLVAMRDIPKDTEVTIDYATLMTTNLFDFKCNCNASVCRGLVTGNDWQKKDLQKKYTRYFQPYILEKINKK